MSDIEREEFEQAVTDRWSDSYSFTRFGDEDYFDEIVEGMWRGWQASRQALEGEPLEVWLGNGDKIVADIYAHNCSFAGIGIFEPEKGMTMTIGESDGKIDGSPLEDTNAIVLIKSTQPESLQVVVEELQEAMAKMGYTHPASADKQAVSVPEWVKCSEHLPSTRGVFLVRMNSVIHDGPKYAVADFGEYGFERSKVTHWMPLPQPPKQEQGE